MLKRSLGIAAVVGTVLLAINQGDDGDPTEVIGKALIAPLVARLLDGIRTGQTPAPSFADGLRAQAVLDAVLESSRRGASVSVDA